MNILQDENLIVESKNSGAKLTRIYSKKLDREILCIEPWYGLSDSINSEKVFKNKNYINSLSVNNRFTESYRVIKLYK